jgi:glycosyltransferase involved in cell wall biosynthesis
MHKKKLFVWCDFLVDTGFGIVAKNLLDTMHEDYDVTVLGINNHGLKKYDTSKYFVYPIVPPDMLGFKRIIQVIKQDQPDLIFLFQDIFHISEVLPHIKKEFPDIPVVSYFPIDGSPVSTAWDNVLTNSDKIITYTAWAKEQIQLRFPDNKKKIEYLYHGVDFKVFYPHAKQHIEKIRDSWKWNDKFVVCNVNRFQPRKAVPLGMRAFSMFAKGYKVCKCGNWMPIDRVKCDLNMCPEEDIIEVHDEVKEDVFLYLHMMPQEPSMGPGRANLLQAHLLNNGFVDTDVNKILGINAKNIYKDEVPASVINDIYNASNINFSTTLGEGVGLSLIESAATGTPSIAPRNSAIPEMLLDTGHLLSNTTVFNMPLDNAHLRPIVDMKEVVKALEIEYKKWKNTDEQKTVNKACLDHANEAFQWGDKVERLKKWFEETLGE